jgi:hypothetical protein
MSRYQVDKALRQVILQEDAAQRFVQNPGEFLKGFDLSEAEREALASVDFRTLYTMGAHPFLLTGFVMRTWRGDRAALMAEYQKAITPLGTPDFST